MAKMTSMIKKVAKEATDLVITPSGQELLVAFEQAEEAILAAPYGEKGNVAQAHGLSRGAGLFLQAVNDSLTDEEKSD